MDYFGGETVVKIKIVMAAMGLDWFVRIRACRFVGIAIMAVASHAFAKAFSGETDVLGWALLPLKLIDEVALVLCVA